MKKFLMVLVVFLIPLSLFAIGFKATWVANTDTDLAGYKVYYGTTTGVYGIPIDVGKTTTCSVGSLKDSTTYYVAITAYDTSGNESAKSLEASITMPDKTPPVVPVKPTLTFWDQIVAWFKHFFNRLS